MRLAAWGALHRGQAAHALGCVQGIPALPCGAGSGAGPGGRRASAALLCQGWWGCGEGALRGLVRRLALGRACAAASCGIGVTGDGGGGRLGLAAGAARGRSHGAGRREGLSGPTERNMHRYWCGDSYTLILQAKLYYVS